jgi:hypothetical protein
MLRMKNLRSCSVFQSAIVERFDGDKLRRTAEAIEGSSKEGIE